jgi:hypothetical protein
MHMKRFAALIGFLVVLFAGTAATAVPTEITVRVKAKDAKFIGTSLGGAAVTIKDLETGELLAKGVTAGSTGDTNRIIKQPWKRGIPISDEKAAKFSVVIDIDKPTYIEVAAYGPLAQTQAANRVSATQWVVPGKHITGGDGLLLEMLGFAVDILDPPTPMKLAGLPQTIQIVANVIMMCGCPIEPEGLWDANGYEVGALVKRNDQLIDQIPLKFAGTTSQFAASFTAKEAGAYEVTVYAYDPANGNTGLDRATFVVVE